MFTHTIEGKLFKLIIEYQAVSIYVKTNTAKNYMQEKCKEQNLEEEGNMKKNWSPRLPPSTLLTQ